MARIKQVEPLSAYRLRIWFDDGIEGEVDLSDLAGQGVFASWLEPGVFEAARVDEETGTVCWPGGIDLCPDTLHEDVLRQRTSGAV